MAAGEEVIEKETEFDIEALASEEQGEPSQAPARKPAPKRRLLLAGGVGLLLVLGAAMLYAAAARRYESTDDAFVEGHVTRISPRVQGTALRVVVDDNQQVRKGDLLVEIDPADFQARLSEARAALQAAVAKRDSAAAAELLTRVTAGATARQASYGVEAAGGDVSEARAKASADLGRAEQAAAVVEAAKAEIAEAEANLAAASAEESRLGADEARYRALYASGVVSEQQSEAAATAAATARARVAAARKRVASAEARLAEAKAATATAAREAERSGIQTTSAAARYRQEVGRREAVDTVPEQLAVKSSEVASAGAEVARAEAAVRQAELDLSYTEIRAPEDGRVTTKAVEQGSLVQPGQVILSLVSDEVWVLANFKETQVDLMRPDQAVELTVDAFPGRTLRGHVDSFQFGTGSRFSLLPAENATGNFVKVVQRLPVKVVVDESPDTIHLLAPGMSVEAAVKVR